MSFGLQVFSSEGATIFDTNSKKIYTLVGRLITRYTPYDNGWTVYVKIPPKFNATNSILVLKLEQWRSPHFGDIWSTGPREVRSGGEIIFSWVGRRHYTDGNYPLLEFYVYSTLPAEQVNDYGMNVYGEDGTLLFNTESSSLQIVEQVNGGISFPGNRLSTNPILDGGGIGIIISANPYLAQTPSSGYVGVQLGMYRRDQFGFVEQRVLYGGSAYVGGHVSFQRTSVATVRLPQATPPTIPW